MNAFEDYLKQLFIEYKESEVINAMKYALLNPGKRVRSALFFKTLELFNITKKYYEIAALIEMIHTYSLIHDDLPAMDNASLRRGKPTVHKMYSENIAILAGDGLLTESFKEIYKADLNDETKVNILKEVIEACGMNGMIYGQELDLAYENKKIEKPQLDTTHNHKTGAMIVLPVRLALIIAKQEQYLTLFSTAMQQFGLAFQVKDDLLDLNNKIILGKDGDDIALNKSTYPSIMGSKRSEELYENLITNSIQLIQNCDIDTTSLTSYMLELAKREY